MSNPEKTKMDTEGDHSNESSGESDYLLSDEDSGVRELVFGLPALKVSESYDFDDDIRQTAILTADLLAAIAEDAGVTKGNVEQAAWSISVDPKEKKKLGRPRKLRLDDGASGSTATGSPGEDESNKKPKKKGSSLLHYPPPGLPTCNICGRRFGSWKAVFGHMRAHKDRGYQGFLPPPTFSAAEEGFGGAIAASSGGGPSGLGTGRLGLDLNADPMEKEEEAGSTPKFDLNRSPPQDGEEEEKKDKA